MDFGNGFLHTETRKASTVWGEIKSGLKRGVDFGEKNNSHGNVKASAVWKKSRLKRRVDFEKGFIHTETWRAGAV